eukprot:537888-Pyramimonas_sp.AAC.1
MHALEIEGESARSKTLCAREGRECIVHPGAAVTSCARVTPPDELRVVRPLPLRAQLVTHDAPCARPQLGQPRRARASSGL